MHHDILWDGDPLLHDACLLFVGPSDSPQRALAHTHTRTDGGEAIL